MSGITKLIVNAHINDLRRDADRAATRTAAVRARRLRNAVADAPVTIRRATQEDERALARLAALDSAPVPAGPVLLAESNGQLRAALSLSDGALIADPFHHTVRIVELLLAFADGAQEGRGKVSRFRRRRMSKGLAVSGRHSRTDAVLT